MFIATSDVTVVHPAMNGCLVLVGMIPPGFIWNALNCHGSNNTKLNISEELQNANGSIIRLGT